MVGNEGTGTGRTGLHCDDRGEEEHMGGKSVSCRRKRMFPVSGLIRGFSNGSNL